MVFDVLLLGLLPFAKTYVSGHFSTVFCDIDLKFGIWICLDIIQINFDFVLFDLLLQELLPFAKISFSGLFSSSSFEILT